MPHFPKSRPRSLAPSGIATPPDLRPLTEPIPERKKSASARLRLPKYSLNDDVDVDYVADALGLKVLPMSKEYGV